jgi:hypothetical protein
MPAVRSGAPPTVAAAPAVRAGPAPSAPQPRETLVPPSVAPRSTIAQAPPIIAAAPTVPAANTPTTPPTQPTPGLPPDRASPVPTSPAVVASADVERDAARVLAVAARTAGADADDKIRQTARSMRAATHANRGPSPAAGRGLNAEARIAWERRDIDTALRLQQRAFELHPNDAEIAGNLAFYYLKVKPAQPALARKLALHALAVRGQAFPAGRAEDWGTLAVASSLVGREDDAIDAMYVMLATSPHPERACRAAHLAAKQYGAPMQAPANAMLARARARGEMREAPSCG